MTKQWNELQWDRINIVMTSNFSDCSGKVLVVDPSGPVRQLLSDVVKGFGFTDIQGCGSMKDAFDFLEVEPVSWVLTPLLADQPVNALHLLKTCTIHPVLNKVRVSLLVAETEYHVLDYAFELGLLSFHEKLFTKDSLAEDVAKLKTALERHDYNETLAAAHFLRHHLTRSNASPNSLLNLEKKLTQIFPGNGKLLVNLATAQNSANEKDKAKNTFRQALLVAPEMKDEITKAAAECFGDEPLDTSGEGEVINLLGLPSVVVIDSDDSVQQTITEVLKNLGVENIHCFNDGEEAFAWISQNDEPGAIIHEWRIPKLSGPMLIQRIRQHGFAEVPLITVSSLIKNEDYPLLREMGVAGIIQKPVVREKFTSQFIKFINQERAPSNQQGLERKIRQLLIGGKRSEADKLKEKFMADSQITEGHKLKIEAEFAYFDEDYTGAKDKAIASLKQTGDSIVLLNLLGKTFMKLHDFEASLKCFKKAQELSPKNIERLCQIADVQTEIGDTAGAEEALDQAKTLDKDNKMIQTQEADRAVKTGDVETARRIMDEMDSVSDFVAYLNNKAVAHSKCGFVEEGIDLYYKTLKAISQDRQNLVPVVRYNLALAKIRNNELEQAVQQLEKVISSKDQRITKKAHSLKIRLEKAIKTGESFKLKSIEAKQGSSQPTGADGTVNKDKKRTGGTSAVTESDHAEIIAAVEAEVGEICCFKVYLPEADMPNDIRALIKSLPRFTHRSAIERAEALGAEKIAKQAS